MITITRCLARQLRTVLRRALHRARGPGPNAWFTADSRGLRVRASHAGAAVEYHSPEPRADEQFCLSLDSLAECEGGNQTPVTLAAGPERCITARWTDRNIPCVASFVAESGDEDFPELPAELVSNEARLLVALREAMATADEEAVRYALHCIQLRGSQGTVAATDGRQMLLQAGFRFPWRDDVLVPHTTVLAHRDLPQDQPVEIGRSERHVVLRCPPWTFYLPIHPEGRFPRIDDYLPNDRNIVSSLHLTAEDADFVVAALPRLPSDDSLNGPVTVDLNGRVALLAKGDNSPATQLILTNSRRTGEPIRFNTNRQYLLRAAKLGFREVLLREPETPAWCRDEHRHYLWALLSKDGLIAADQDTIEIHSPAGKPATKPIPRRTTVMSPTKTTGPDTNGKAMPSSASSDDSVEPAGIAGILSHAEAVRASLRQAHADLSRLIAALKRHRKQSRLVQTTLASLKQLQTLEA